MSVTEGLDQVVALAHEVTQLRHRLAQLDGERARIEGEIAGCMNRIAVAAIAAVSPADSQADSLPAAPPAEGPKALSAAILTVIRQSPQKVFTALEISSLLRMTNRRNRSAIRTHLSRMAKDGRVAKLAFGKYRAR
jgi:hypothetical protein